VSVDIIFVSVTITFVSKTVSVSVAKSVLSVTEIGSLTIGVSVDFFLGFNLMLLGLVSIVQS
jgi:hypothetical protein